jgi:hypothetical protein
MEWNPFGRAKNFITFEDVSNNEDVYPLFLLSVFRAYYILSIEIPLRLLIFANESEECVVVLFSRREIPHNPSLRHLVVNFESFKSRFCVNSISSKKTFTATFTYEREKRAEMNASQNCMHTKSRLFLIPPDYSNLIGFRMT